MASNVAELNELLKQASRGDREAFAKVFDLTSAKLFGIALRILRDRGQAEEVVQEAYIKIWRNAARFDGARSSPITWMATITRNAAIDRVRRRSRDAQASEEDVLAIIDDSPTQEAQMEARQAEASLSLCLEELEPDHRDAVRLAYLEGLSRQELAERFKAPVGTIKSWLRRSLLKLKECLSR